jgi:hypothetical protein
VKAKRWLLGRREFLAAAGLENVNVQAVKRFCKNIALHVHHTHLEGTT